MSSESTAKIFSATTVGFNGTLIEIECDMTKGLPSIVIVGLANKAVDEAKERLRSSIRNSHLTMPRKRITFNLAPANLPKDGTNFDLPMAVALLTASGQIKSEGLGNSLFVGELALDGTLRPIRGAIAFAEAAKRHGFKAIYLPRQNAKQAALISDIDIYPVNNLETLVKHFSKACISPATYDGRPSMIGRHAQTDFSEIYGQQQAKRALEIAVAGGHNILLSGPPGAGKTMMARALLSIMPEPSEDEIIEITKLHSLAGEATEDAMLHRPFRSPHHTSSSIALIGGGKNPKPGEISLAHKGILFLDELPEYTRSCLESLRQPLEDKLVTIARAQETLSFPADFMLVATQNPCPCGYYRDPDHTCSCTPHQINQYSKKISGPLLDRIDLVINVKKVPHKHLLSDQADKYSESLAIKKRVNDSRKRQQRRFNSSLRLNTHMKNREFMTIGKLSPKAKQFLETAADKLHLSARSYMKVIRVGRTIADLSDNEVIEVPHISEALQYRPRS